MLILLVFLISLFQPEVPLKPSEEFDCRLNLSFKSRNATQQPTVDYSETIAERDKRLSGSPLPYLIIKLKFVTLQPEEFRMQVVGNGSVLRSKKILQGEEVEIDLGFTDDIKDGISPREYIVFVQTKDRQPTSRITISFTKEGDFLVNGVKRGRI